MAGVMFGSLAALVLAAWSSRSVWRGAVPARPDWSWVRPWFALTLGLAAGTVMLGADSSFVQSTFTAEEKAFYVAAGKVGRALVYFTMPLALVLFPRIARSAATGQPTGSLKLALGATLGTGTAAALVCSAVPELPIRLLYFRNPVFLPAAELVPLFCWCLLPLTAAYTLVNSILARKRFAAVPWLLLVAAGYAVTLAVMRPEMVRRVSPRFQPSEIRPSWIERLRHPSSPLDLHLLDTFPPDLRQTLAASATDAPPADDLPARLAESLNRRLEQGSLHEPARFGDILLRPETRALLERRPDGPDRLRLNRLLLEDAYPEALERRSLRALFDEFRRVIATLGVFSVLLLGVAILFSLPRGEATAASNPA